MSDAPAEQCRAFKAGRVNLHCELDAGHEGWHQADFEHRETITYSGARHDIVLTEHVEWEPVSAVQEAARHLEAAAAERRAADG